VFDSADLKLVRASELKSRLTPRLSILQLFWAHENANSENMLYYSLANELVVRTSARSAKSSCDEDIVVRGGEGG
jgi:hypothetical protein